MKTLHEINNNILKKYKDFDRSNENWNIGSYLNIFYDLNAAISFSKLFLPDFVEKKDCVIIAMRYDKKVFEQWYNEFNGNISEIEKMCNLYELKDFFHINLTVYESTDESEKALDYFGESLKKSWEISLNKLYPNKNFKVKLFEEYNSKFITFCSHPN